MILGKKKRKQGVPLPVSLPGRFFVMLYTRSNQTFTLVVDDQDHSSYDLGTDIPDIMRQFRLWHLAVIGDSAVDIAKEFGKAQAIFSDGRVIPLTDAPTERNVAEELSRIEEEQDNAAQRLHYL